MERQRRGGCRHLASRVHRLGPGDDLVDRRLQLTLRRGQAVVDTLDGLLIARQPVLEQVELSDPQPGEIAAVLVDLPHGDLADTDEWRQRRAMAERWADALSLLAKERDFQVMPLVNFEATGMNNGDLPAVGAQAGHAISLEEIGERATLLLAMTQFSASAPLIGWTARYPKLRVASMPRVAPEMESTALAADELVLLKSTLPARIDSVEALADAGIVDRYFPTAVRAFWSVGRQAGKASARVRLVDLRDEQFSEAALERRV